MDNIGSGTTNTSPQKLHRNSEQEGDSQIYINAEPYSGLLKAGQSGGTTQQFQFFNSMRKKVLDAKNTKNIVPLTQQNDQSDGIQEFKLDKDLVSKIINFKKNYHKEIEQAKEYAIKSYHKFQLMDNAKKMRICLILFVVGFLGIMTSGIGLMAIISIQKIKQEGLISYLSPKLKNLLLNWSIYDILCELFYIRTFSITLMNVILPFTSCHSPKEVKEVLDSMKEDGLGPKVHGALFRKGLIFNFSEKLQSIMLPADKTKIKKMTKVQKAIAKLTRNVDAKRLKQGLIGSQNFTNDGETDDSDITTPQKDASEEFSRKKQFLKSTSMIGGGTLRKKPSLRNDLKERLENIQKRSQLEGIVSETIEEQEDNDDFFSNKQHSSLNNQNLIKKNEFSFNELQLAHGHSKSKVDLLDQITQRHSKLNQMLEELPIQRKQSHGLDFRDFTQESSGGCPENEDNHFQSADSDPKSPSFNQVKKDKLRHLFKSEGQLIPSLMHLKDRLLEKYQGSKDEHHSDDDIASVTEDQPDLKFVSLIPHDQSQVFIKNNSLHRQQKLSLMEIVKNPDLLVDRFRKRFQYYVKHNMDTRKLKMMLGLFIIALIVQFKYSPKARAWAKHFGQYGLFLSTAVGLLGTFGSLVIKNKIERDWEKLSKEEVKRVKHIPILPKFKRIHY
ncbi:UNKNOWN [Stylonychia lemnae]|uniref:Transmembrane protein n=1 Tax=Stylonychia lemnae TaxID=5949 RepID=A0A078AZG9_STYLE|nr:UNKNOWN [Stylonychia lemnae]|eukprot:CDW87549.1 UNKNOWN [Stylonychia lemnae]